MTTLHLFPTLTPTLLPTTVLEAAAEYRVSPTLIASILADERRRLDPADWLQDKLLRLGQMLPEKRQRLMDAGLEKLCGRPVDTFSLGRAQMKGTTLRALARRGYITLEDSPSARRRLLLDDAQAPGLVAACLRATIDHWQAGGVNLSHRPDILGTLYSIGLEGRRGVHPNPQANARGRAIARYAVRLEERAASRYAAAPV